MATGGQRGVFLSWTRGNRRTADLAAVLDVEPVFVCVGTQRAATAPLRWAVQGAMSLPALLRPRTSSIVLMMPPYPALVLCRAVARMRRIPLVIDAHSAVFEDRRFARFLPRTIAAMQRSELTVVTNSKHRELLESHSAAVTELHDPPAPIEPVADVAADGHVLVPASWHADEPIGELIEVARARPTVDFVFTGRAPTALLDEIGELPSNVALSGFVSDEEYTELLRSSSAVCCLTMNDNTMQRGGYEALATGLPLVTSDFGLLRDYFGDAAQYAEPTTASIVAALDRLHDDHAGHAERMAARRDEVAAQYHAGLQPIIDALDS